jgi:hypothetical protein
MKISEGVIRATLSSHLQHVSHETAARVMDVDVVGAFGLGSGKLAQYIAHWQASTNEAEVTLWLRRTWRLLIRRTAKDFRIRNKGDAGRRSYAVLERACFHSLMEWAHPECITCAGVGKVGVRRYEVAPDVQVDDLFCQSCRGTGTRRYSDKERVVALGVTQDELEKVWSERLSGIMVEITKQVSRGVYGTKERLA